MHPLGTWGWLRWASWYVACHDCLVVAANECPRLGYARHMQVGNTSSASMPTMVGEGGSLLPQPGMSWDPASGYSACAQVKADLKYLFETALSPGRIRHGHQGSKHEMALHKSLQVLHDTKHFVKDYGGASVMVCVCWAFLVEKEHTLCNTGIGLPAGLSPPPNTWRLLVSMRLSNALPPFLQPSECNEISSDGADEVGDAEKQTRKPRTKQAQSSATLGPAKRRKGRKHPKWTRHKGMHRKQVPATAFLSNNAASTHAFGERGECGFPQRLLDAAAIDSAVAKGLRLRLHSEVPPFVVVVAAGELQAQLGAFLCVHYTCFFCPHM